MSKQPARYAIYFAPDPDSALWRFGSAVLGYDGVTGEDVPDIVPEGFEIPDWRLLTADPRAYGFHATIKAPFRLAQDQTEEDLVTALQAFADSRTPFVLPKLEVAIVGAREGEGAFVALVEPKPSPALAELEAAALEAFEPFRAPLTDKEFSRRLPETLTTRQRDYLNRYGYPFVLEDFRFHLTLTGRVPEDEVEAVHASLEALYKQHVGNESVRVDALAVYHQEKGAGRFRVLARAPFRG